MILQEILRGQPHARGRAHGPPQRGLDSSNEPGRNVRAEYSYRRGFNQGAWFAVCAVKGGATLAELRAWIDDVEEWRNRDRRTCVEWPPLTPKMRTR